MTPDRIPDNTPELPENFTYEQGRETRMRPDAVRPGYECLLRFRNLATGDFFESSVTVRESLTEDEDCDRLYVDIHCKTFDREVEFQFDKETGCIIQYCQGERQEIGYIVSLREPSKTMRVVDSAAALERRLSGGHLPADTLIN